MVKAPPASGRDTREEVLIPGSGRSPGRGSGNPLQCSCLENSKDREAWRATVLGDCKESDMTEHTQHGNPNCTGPHCMTISTSFG